MVAAEEENMQMTQDDAQRKGPTSLFRRLSPKI